jgi:hypothetical protein
MQYVDGRPVELGDRVRLWADCTGTVVCAIDNNAYLDSYPREEWSYLGRGVLIHTDDRQIFHYLEPDEDLALVERRSRAAGSPTVG